MSVVRLPGHVALPEEIDALRMPGVIRDLAGEIVTAHQGPHAMLVIACDLVLERSRHMRTAGELADLRERVEELEREALRRSVPSGR